MNIILLHTIYPIIYHCVYGWIRLWGSSSQKKWLYARESIPTVPTVNKKSILFCCASVGEYKMIEPLATKLSSQWSIHISCFSDSGYEYVNQLRKWDVVSYFPLETHKSLRTFFDHFSPVYIVISGHDIWPNFLYHAVKREIKFCFIGFQYRMTPWYSYLFFKLMISILRESHHIFTPVKKMLPHLASTNIHQVSLITFPRLRTIADRVNSQNSYTNIEKWKNNQSCLILGSTHKYDDNLILQSITSLTHYKIIWVPHVIDDEYSKWLKTKLPSAYIYQFNNAIPLDCQHLIINEYGLLPDLYRYAEVAYIGGGFDKGIHSILECIYHQKPVIIGPRYHRFYEAKLMLEVGCVRSIKNSEELINAISFYSHYNIDWDKVGVVLRLNQLEDDLYLMADTISHEMDQQTST